MKYTVVLRKQPIKYLKKLDKKAIVLFRKKFIELEETPLKIARTLHGELTGLRKIAVGKMRMVILINSDENIIDVLEIGPRGDIYK